MSYVELITKSNFSFLTGASHPEELIQKAIDLGLAGLALTDQNGLYGLGRAFKVAKHHPNFKLILGSELSFFNHPNVILYARHRRGYAALCRILTQAHQGQEKGHARLEFSDFLAQVQGFGAQNFLVIPRLTEKTNLKDLKEAFSSQMYLPLTFYLDGQDEGRIQKVQAEAQKWDLKILATNDVYYHCKERKNLQDVLISVREGKPLSEVGYQHFSNAERFIKSFSQMQKLYQAFPEFLSNTIQFADQCDFSPRELKYTYPSEWIPQSHTAQSYLEYLVQQCAPGIYRKGIPEAVQKQLQHELSLIRELGYADYFLTIYDIVDFARSKDILCQGRGSAANSVVCYVLGITAIDPVQMNLLFERFMSAERNEPPDIDVDFEHERREEVIQYIYSKYGRDRAAMVSAVVTYRWRSAFREVCKAFAIPVGTLSAKKVERDFDELMKDWAPAEMLTPQINLQQAKQKLKEKIFQLTEQLEGFPRHLSIHSGGFTLSATAITEIVPVEPARMPGRSIIQWDKYDLDELGLLKIDILSLGMLSALKKSLDLIGMKLHEIPHDDQPTFDMIGRCDTVGTFQIESRAQMSMLGRLQPKTFYDLVIEVAIVRPGPIVGKMIHPYLRRRTGLEKISFPNEKVRSILGKTLGIPLFQEQVMKLAIELADFTPGEADILRKTINAWKTSAPIGEMGNRLMQGLLKNGLPQSFADQIFEQIQGFSHYGFPESHAASFALLAYASCYIKKHHPAVFASSLINSQPMGFYRPDTIIYDAVRHGVKVLPVCIQKSQWDCTIEAPNTIRLGFRLVKGLAKKDVDHLVEERQQLKFSSLTDFLRRSHLRKDILHRLALAGRLSGKEMDSRQTLWAILEYENLFKDYQSGQQLSLFDQCDDLLSDTFLNKPKEFFAPIAAANQKQFTNKNSSSKDLQSAHKPLQSLFKALTPFELIQEDYNAFSASTHGHPMSQMRLSPQVSLAKGNSKSIRQLDSGQSVAVGGLTLVRQKPPTAKGTVFATIEDEFGFVDLILHADVYKKFREIFLNHCFINVTGTLQKDGNTVSVLVKKVSPIWNTKNLDETPLPLEPTQYFYS